MRGSNRVKVSLRGRIRTRSRPDAPDRPESSTQSEIPRMARLLALAYRWHRMIDEDEVESQAEIARRLGLTPARVSQIMDLRWIAPELQANILLEDTVGHRKELGSLAAPKRLYWSCSRS